MSVINQMLKDLDKRTPEQGHGAVPSIITKKTSTVKIVMLCVLVLLTLNALGFYIWSLQEQIEASEQAKHNSIKAQVQVSNQAVDAIKEQINNEKAVEEKAENKERDAIESNRTVAKKSGAVQESIAVNKHEANHHQATKIEKNVTNIDKETMAKASTSLPQANDAFVNKAQLTSPIDKTEIKTEDITETSSNMSISRRQLSSEELIAQKLARAEKLVNLNEIFKAEQFFEDILIIDPNHKQARKKLAALWFGRRAYQQATNLLSQGIALDNQDSELRMLKARIYIKQGKHEDAYNTLKPLATIEQEEYQVMLANIAQQIEQFQSAIIAYQVLIKMQPYSGRWHLGLAIVYDKTSQFSLAVNEYALALTKTDLSASSAKFAQQRMQALGE